MSDETIRRGFRDFLVSPPDRRTGLEVPQLEALRQRIVQEREDLDREERIRMFKLALTECRRCGGPNLTRFDHCAFVSVHCRGCYESWDEQRPTEAPSDE